MRKLSVSVCAHLHIRVCVHVGAVCSGGLLKTESYSDVNMLYFWRSTKCCMRAAQRTMDMIYWASKSVIIQLFGDVAKASTVQSGLSNIYRLE